MNKLLVSLEQVQAAQKLIDAINERSLDELIIAKNGVIVEPKDGARMIKNHTTFNVLRHMIGEPSLCESTGKAELFVRAGATLAIDKSDKDPSVTLHVEGSVFIIGRIDLTGRD